MSPEEMAQQLRALGEDRNPVLSTMLGGAHRPATLASEGTDTQIGIDTNFK